MNMREANKTQLFYIAYHDNTIEPIYRWMAVQELNDRKRKERRYKRVSYREKEVFR